MDSYVLHDFFQPVVDANTIARSSHIRSFNTFCRVYLTQASNIPRQSLIQAKNNQIRYFAAFTKAWGRRLILLYFTYRCDPSILAISAKDCFCWRTFSPIFPDINPEYDRLDGPEKEEYFEYTIVSCKSASELFHALHEIRTSAKIFPENNDPRKMDVLRATYQRLHSIKPAQMTVQHRKSGVVQEWSSFAAGKLLKTRVELYLQSRAGGVRDNHDENWENQEKEEIKITLKKLERMGKRELDPKKAYFWYRKWHKLSTRLGFDQTDGIDELINVLLHIDRYEEAIPLIKDKLRSAEVNLRGVSSTQFLLASAYKGVHQYPKAMKWYQKSIQSSLNEDVSVSSTASIGLADALRLQRDFPSAEGILLLLLEEDGEKKEICTGIGRVYADWGKLEQALEWLKKGVRLREKNAELKLEIGGVYVAMERFAEADQIFTSLLNRRDLPISQKAQVLTWFGYSHVLQCRTASAHQLLVRALRLASCAKAGNLGLTLLAIGIQSLAIGDLSKAETMLKQAESTYNDPCCHGDVRSLCVLTTLTEVYLAAGRMEDGFSTVMKAVELAGQFPEHIETAAVFQVFGRLNLSIGNITEARKWFENAYEIAANVLPTHSQIGLSCLYLAMIAALDGNFALAETNLKQAKAVFSLRNSLQRSAIDGYTALADVYNAANKMEEAKLCREEAGRVARQLELFD